MPRGFLVKRNKRAAIVSYRIRSLDEEDYMIDPVNVQTKGTELYSQPFNSPDSGYGHSPLSLLINPLKGNKDNVDGAIHIYQEVVKHYQPIIGHQTPPCSLPSSSPIQESAKLSPSPELPPLRLPLSAPVIGHTLKRALYDCGGKASKAKKPKSARKIAFDDDNRSPVHGTIIKDLSDDEKEKASVERGGKKPGGLGGDFVCKLCKEEYPDSFSLAQHKCSRIVHVEYRCPECDKVFNCPANLASHRRWHKPRPTPRRQNSSDTFTNQSSLQPPKTEIPSPFSAAPQNIRTMSSTAHASEQGGKANTCEDTFYQCEQCDKKFRRPTNLRKHLQQHGEDEMHPCHYCGKVFGSITNRTKHMLTHAIPGIQQPPEAIVTCRVCGGLFGDEDALIRHERLHHHQLPTVGPGQHLYPCKYCSSLCSSASALSKHIDERHPTEHRRRMLLNVPVRI